MAAGWFGVLYRNAAGLLAALIVLAPAAARGQDSSATEDRVADTLAKAHQALTAIPPRPSCAGGDPDEIVVCAPTDSDRYRVPSSTDENPASRAALRTGAPSPPQLDRGSCKGQPGCIIGGWVPPPIYYVDLKAIPEAPAGSEADLIARGEKAER